ncbi:hypothetical protein FOZ62_003727, partial [Perkinsus olseni]
MIGGRHHDELFEDMWILDVQRSPRGARQWSRIDGTIRGPKPPPAAYHTLNYASTATGDMVVLLGGLTWSKTRIAETDVLRDLDRRCFKQAKDIYSQFCTEDGSSCDLDKAFESIEMQCNTTNAERGGENHVGPFCCEVLADRDSITTASELSRKCKALCQTNAFSAEFDPRISEGV